MSQRTLIISHLCEKSEGIRIPLVPRVKTWNIDEDGRGAKVTGCAILTPLRPLPPAGPPTPQATTRTAFPQACFPTYPVGTFGYFPFCKCFSLLTQINLPHECKIFHFQVSPC